MHQSSTCVSHHNPPLRVGKGTDATALAKIPLHHDNLEQVKGFGHSTAASAGLRVAHP
jgi:hypothetical protein